MLKSHIIWPVATIMDSTDIDHLHITESFSGQHYSIPNNLLHDKHNYYFYLWLYLIITGAAQVKIRLKIHNPWIAGPGDFLWNGWPKGISTQKMIQTSMGSIVRSWPQSQEI